VFACQRIVDADLWPRGPCAVTAAYAEASKVREANELAVSAFRSPKGYNCGPLARDNRRIRAILALPSARRFPFFRRGSNEGAGEPYCSSISWSN